MGLRTNFERIGIRDADEFLDVVEKQLKLIDDICSTVDNFKIDLLDETGLDEVPGAKLKHAMRALIIGVIAASGTSPATVDISLVAKKPYLKVTCGQLGTGVTKVTDSPKWIGWMGDDH